MKQASLFEAQPVFTVHCFWSSCSHVVRGPDPQMNHDRMEQHYNTMHADAIKLLVGQ